MKKNLSITGIWGNDMTENMVLGVGNILLSDEGFGVRVVEELQRRGKVAAHIQVLDGGTLGFGLLQYLDGVKRLLLIDAIEGVREPGALYELRGTKIQEYFQTKLSVHQLGMQEVLAALSLLGRPIEELIVLGVQPQSLEVGLELSPLVQSVLEPVLNRVLALLAEW